MGRYSHRQPVLHSSHTTFHRGWSIVFYHSVEVFCDGHCKTFLPQDVFSKTNPCMATWPVLKIASTRKIGKHVLSDIRYRKTCVLTSDFVLGVGGGRLPCILSKILTVS
jgi:hypothetical protein